MSENDEVESLSQDLKILQIDLRKARQERRFFDDAMNRVISLNPDLEQERQNLGSEIEWTEKMLEYMKMRIKNARK